MSVDKGKECTDSASCFLSLSEKLSEIFMLTSHRLTLMSESLSASIHSQTLITPDPSQSSTTRKESPSQFKTSTSSAPRQPPIRCDPVPNIGSAGLSRKSHHSPSSPLTPSETPRGAPNLNHPAKHGENRPASPLISPPHCITSRQEDGHQALQTIVNSETVHPPPAQLAPPGDSNGGENTPASLNLMQRIASPPRRVSGVDDTASSSHAQNTNLIPSQSCHSSPMDLRESDSPKQNGPKQNAPTEDLRALSPKSPANYRTRETSCNPSSSRARSSSCRLSTSLSSRSTSKRYQQQRSLRSSGRVDSKSGQPPHPRQFYESFKPQASRPRTLRSRSRSRVRRSRSRSMGRRARSRSWTRRSRSRSRSWTRRSRSSSLTRPSCSRSIIRRTRSRSPIRRGPERPGSPSTCARFIDRIDNRSEREFAEYLDHETRGRPRYHQLVAILRSLHGSNLDDPVPERDLFDEFHRFRHRTDTREEHMLRYLSYHPYLMYKFLLCASYRDVITYWPDRHYLGGRVRLYTRGRSPIRGN
ncbi:hypothetical protein PCANC_05016 [Puccinia coronata f. sp. avenae]|uniref:Uncharacterized protein n=1 Tax=Puccinia coronata f. sp. avenae TaxID=200324 RepID=A0A2N5T7L5_9BASI|nr:hypothetical protein PCANC_05016 [Puccinia coronata f. sp. avenae]